MHRIRLEMSRPEQPAPDLISLVQNRDPRAHTLAQLGSGSHSDSASESARKPGVPSSQDLRALGPRRLGGRPGRGIMWPRPQGGTIAPVSVLRRAALPLRGAAFKQGEISLDVCLRKAGLGA